MAGETGYDHTTAKYSARSGNPPPPPQSQIPGINPARVYNDYPLLCLSWYHTYVHLKTGMTNTPLDRTCTDPHVL